MRSAQEFTNLQTLLRKRASETRHGDQGKLIFYPLSDPSSPVKVSYSELYHQTKRLGEQLIIRSLLEAGKPILIHLDDHHDTLLCFWAVLILGGVPVISSPQSLSNVDKHRAAHLAQLAQLFESPVCITRAGLLHQFECFDNTANSNGATLGLHTIESLKSDGCTFALTAGITNAPDGVETESFQGQPDDLAVLMLTSGSTGNAKAVCLTHRQILAAIRGKALVRDLSTNVNSGRAGTFLNWIGLDHVASLIELHLQALYLDADQVHVHAADVVSYPATFLDLCSRHAVARTFAPNFFLASLVSSFQSQSSGEDGKQTDSEWDLSNLRMIASGGEANDVQTCKAAGEILARFGCKLENNIIVPGFGMTETCAGAIFNTSFPGYDISNGYKFSSVGQCMEGIEMQITRPGDASVARRAVKSEITPCGELGNLEVRGEAVFRSYYRDPISTSEAFTSDGWFKTGDRAFIDSEGSLCLAGRSKDVVNINGVKIPTADLQSAIEMALSTNAVLRTLVTRLVCFAARDEGAATEQVVVAYVTTVRPVEGKKMVGIQNIVTNACALVHASCSRSTVFGLSQRSMELLPVTTLGKVSRVKMRVLFEAGVFDDDIRICKANIWSWQNEHMSRSQQEVSHVLDDGQQLLRSEVAGICNAEDTSVGLDVSFFHLGFTSMDVIKLKHHLDKRLGTSVPVIDIMKNPTVRQLATALRKVKTHKPEEYDPVVTLRSGGSKTPLWLIHPGVGEVLVFVALAKHMETDDRPVHALRARGFEPRQPRFGSITEAAETYVKAIRRLQSSGPYCLAGYSYGAMLAFEIAKRLEDVKFLGNFNLPPHIKNRMRQLSWNMCLLHLAQFLGVVAEELVEAETSSTAYALRNHEGALDRVFHICDRSRMAELGLTRDALGRWTDVAHGLQSMAADYEPSGAVDSIDVFHAEPLRVAASSREEWVLEHLSRWDEFSRTTPRLHAVGGAHYTMLGQEHVGLFAKKLEEALAARGM